MGARTFQQRREVSMASSVGGAPPADPFEGFTSEVITPRGTVNNGNGAKQTRRLTPHCLSQTAVKALLIGTDLAAIGGTSYVIVNELLNTRSITPLTLATAGNGMTLSLLAYLTLPSSTRKMLVGFFNGWSWPATFAGGQVLRNQDVTADIKKLYRLPFIEGLGLLLGHNLIETIFGPRPDLHTGYEPIGEEEYFATLSLSTRNYSKTAKCLLLAFAVSAVGAISLNVLLKQLDALDDLGTIQDLLEVYAGSVAGDFMARGVTYLQRPLEERYRHSHSEEEASTMFKALRITQNIVNGLIPFLNGGLIALPIAFNTLPDGVIKFGLGVMYGHYYTVTKELFSNPSSSFHQDLATENDERANDEIVIANKGWRMHCTKKKVIQFCKNYLPSFTFLSGLTGYMIGVAKTNPEKADNAIYLMLASSYLGFLGTAFTTNEPSRGNSWGCLIKNELIFRKNFPIGLALLYLLLEEKMDIGDQSLEASSGYFYFIRIFLWFVLGLNIGNDRANRANPRTKQSTQISSPITRGALTQAVNHNLTP